jgi:hypothetical protein
VDVWALADVAKLVEEARAVRDGLVVLAVLNAADPGVSADNSEAAAALADFPQLALLDAPITRRKAFANATGHGLSVDELMPLDPKASAELAALMGKVASFAYRRPRRCDHPAGGDRAILPRSASAAMSGNRGRLNGRWRSYGTEPLPTPALQCPVRRIGLGVGS